MPKNTGAGFVIAMLSTALGFSIIWHMWLVAGIAFLALMAVVIAHTFNYDREFYVSATDVTEIERARTRQLAAHV
jgi:cytochrome o ubiquinol oxidase subunit 1